MEKLHGLDLFSGIGGITKALDEWVQPIAYCEIDPYAQAVLLSRMSTGELPTAPIWDDVCTLPTNELPKIDIIYGGFPCQDISIAGAGKGLEGSRSGLFFEIMRLVDVLRPQFIFLENVPAITSRGLITVAEEITKRSYDSRWCTLSASEVGAPHKRERWWLLANPNSKRLQGQRQKPFGTSEELQNIGNSCWWATEPSVGRVANGIPCRVDRIKGLGNAVVPQCAKTAFKQLLTQ